MLTNRRGIAAARLVETGKIDHHLAIPADETMVFVGPVSHVASFSAVKTRGSATATSSLGQRKVLRVEIRAAAVALVVQWAPAPPRVPVTTSWAAPAADYLDLVAHALAAPPDRAPPLYHCR